MLQDELVLKRALCEELTYEAKPDDISTLQHIFMGVIRTASALKSTLGVVCDGIWGGITMWISSTNRLVILVILPMRNYDRALLPIEHCSV